MSSPLPKHKMGRRVSFLSRASSQLSFKSVRSHFTSKSGKRRKSIQEILVTVDQIKPHVLLAFEDDPQLFHPKDVERINKSDSFIERFIIDHQNRNKNNWEEILKMVLDSLKWRKQFGINDLNPKMFPKEFYDLKFVRIGQVNDKEFAAYSIARGFRRIDGLQDRILQFVIYVFESIAEEYDGDVKVSSFLDLSNFSLSNCDVKLFLTGIPIFLKNYPAIADHAYVYELSWLLKPVTKVIMACLPRRFQDMVTFVSKSDCKQMIPEEKLADYMGGSLKFRKLDPDPDCITIEELCNELGMSESQMKSAKKLFAEGMKDMEKFENSYNK